jgi:membrane-associated phospholipid phosphatase
VLGQAYTLIPIAAGFYFLGTTSSSERFRETGLLSFEALADSTIVEVVVKSITDRARPLESNGKGHFWDSPNPRYNFGFPSRHSINTFAMASVFAHECHDKLWVKLICYGYAGGVMGARLAAKKHFPGEVMAGAAMGWFIGDYVYGKRHNSELDHKNVARTVLERIHFGLARN